MPLRAGAASSRRFKVLIYVPPTALRMLKAGACSIGSDGDLRSGCLEVKKRKATKDKAMQSNPKQSIAKQSKARQSNAKQTYPSRAEQREAR